MIVIQCQVQTKHFDSICICIYKTTEQRGKKIEMLCINMRIKRNPKGINSIRKSMSSIIFYHRDKEMTNKIRDSMLITLLIKSIPFPFDGK